MHSFHRAERRKEKQNKKEKRKRRKQLMSKEQMFFVFLFSYHRLSAKCLLIHCRKCTQLVCIPATEKKHTSLRHCLFNESPSTSSHAIIICFSLLTRVW